MAEVWFADTKSLRAERTTCETVGWPHRDEQGRTMFKNTHFATEREAWEKLQAEVKAGFRMAGRDVVRVRAELGRAEAQALESGLRALAVDEAFAEFEKREARDAR